MKPLVLVILDGWGLSPNLEGNAILRVPTPNYDKLLSVFPNTTLHASGEEVGLDWGEMGNSEVGHLNLGTGRVVTQDLPRINQTISDGRFFVNPELLNTFEYAKRNNSNLHLIGLYSSGGVHSHYNHLFALLELAKKQDFKNVFIHIITDGRDTPPKTILNDLPKLYKKFDELKLGKVASVMGRYYAMDRDKREERIAKAFKVLTEPFNIVNTPEDAVNNTYNIGKTDEFIEPSSIIDTPRIKEKDAVIFYNFRADRAKEISEKITMIKDIFFTSFTSYGYEPTSLIRVAFFVEKVQHQLASILADNNIHQLHIAETEKYPHVTYFFNGGLEKPFLNEKRIMVASPKVETYDLQPEMSAGGITEKFTNYYKKERPEFTVLNFANADMVGHTGSLEATEKAIQVVDTCLGQVSEVVLNSGADIIITADHGNAEQLINLETGEIDKEHTTNPVPLILGFAERMNRKALNIVLENKVNMAIQTPVGVLADVTATVCSRLKLKRQPDFTGQSLEDL